MPSVESLVLVKYLTCQVKNKICIHYQTSIWCIDYSYDYVYESLFLNFIRTFVIF